MREYFEMFIQLLTRPFDQFTTAWGILPIYTSLLLGELYKSKVSFGHAVGNGFVMLWAGLNWARHLSRAGWTSYLFASTTVPWIVTGACIALGLFTIVLGIRKKDKALCEILGHTRFSCYFLILFYPMQAGLMHWSGSAVAVILIFALPCWFIIYALGRAAARLIK